MTENGALIFPRRDGTNQPQNHKNHHTTRKRLIDQSILLVSRRLSTWLCAIGAPLYEPWMT
jgi:hypothetical protein